ncbi:MAG: DUF4339 domain-containing protein [Oceanicaulis sp.]|nr:DUF4339 domain-containing protein [Oceanicaulis sp.]
MPRDDGIAMSWFVKVEGRVYGPYTGAQMRAFISEGRVAAHSSVSDRREDGFRAAQDIAQLKTWLDEARRSPGEKRSVPSDARTANFVIVAELNPASAPGFEAALADFGEVEPITPGVWLLRGAASASHLRNELSHLLAREDRLLVVDASRDRTAWFNLGREADERIRTLWGRST